MDLVVKELFLDPEYCKLSNRRVNQQVSVFIDVPEYHVTCYLRKTVRYCSKLARLVPTIDIATIEVVEKHRSKGNCGRFLEGMAGLAKKYGRHLFVECVHNELLADMLIRRGYEEDTVPENYWLFV